MAFGKFEDMPILKNSRLNEVLLNLKETEP